MPIESPDKEFFNVAVGYTQLRMFVEANEQLENIDPFNRVAPEVLALRVEIYRGLEKWDLMQQIAQRLHEFSPNDVQWIVSYAYATRRADGLSAARDILVASLPKFPREPILYYNLACYDCQLDRIDSAKENLKRAFEIDSRWRLEAADDKDLKPLWDSL